MNKIAILLGAGLGLLAAAGCGPRPPGAGQGYIEGEFVYVGAPLGGQLTRLAVSRGQEVQAGQLLFELESAAESAAVREAQGRLAQARSRLENLRKGRRPSEIASLEARLKSARASLELAEAELRRRVALRAENVISIEELDAYQARRDTDREAVKTLEADLETARLSAREDEVKAAEAEARAAEAGLEKALWALGQKRQAAPEGARVQDTLYRAGEYVAAGTPVVSLLPPANVKVRFFVPQDDLAQVKIGGAARVRLDGAGAPLTARIGYVSSRAEFTPPVLYNRENRSKLVFMVEAVFDPKDAPALHPGQPAEVRYKP